MGSKAAGVEFVTQAKECMHAHRAQRAALRSTHGPASAVLCAVRTSAQYIKLSCQQCRPGSVHAATSS